MPRNIIIDGYTKRAHVKPLEGIHQGLTFEYRPMLPEEVEDLDALDGKHRDNPKEHQLAIAKMIAAKMSKWDEEGANGETVTITGEAMRRMPPALAVQIRQIVMGFRASDPNPNGTPAENAAIAKAREQEAQGLPPGQMELAQARKN